MKESVMNNPGQYLKSIRKKRGYGVKTVYKKTGVGDSTIRRIEEGKTKFPPAAQLKTLANFYNINLIELYKANAEFLDEESRSSIQGLINLLAEKRTL